jgi:hypothetical protein
VHRSRQDTQHRQAAKKIQSLLGGLVWHPPAASLTGSGHLNPYKCIYYRRHAEVSQHLPWRPVFGSVALTFAMFGAQAQSCPLPGPFRRRTKERHLRGRTPKHFRPIPTLLLFRGGKVVAKSLGPISKTEVHVMLDAHL